MSTSKIYAFYFNEDGDPPSLTIFNDRAAFLKMIEKDHDFGCAKIIDLEKFNSERDTGYVVIEGKPVKLVPKTSVTKWDAVTDE